MIAQLLLIDLQLLLIYFSNCFTCPSGRQPIHLIEKILLLQCHNLSQSSQANSHEAQEFETKLTVAHYYATRSAAMPSSSLATIATKLSVSLLRHSDVIPADKAFYEAGMMCKVVEHLASSSLLPNASE